MSEAAKKPGPDFSMMMKTLSAIRTAADTACDSAQEAGVEGAINWADLGVVEVRFCIDEQGDCSYDVLIEEAAPGCVDLMRHVSGEIAKIGLPYGFEVRTEW